MSNEQTKTGPLKLQLSPPNMEAARAVQKLRGSGSHSTSDLWLPEGLWPELDELRSEHLRVRSQVAAELTALEALDQRFREEDKQHEHKLCQAHRDGDPASVEDRRTPSEQREGEREAIEERLWAGVIVFAEIVDQVVALSREREDSWLADLRSQLGPAREKRAEAQRLLEEAKAEEWALHRRGQWVQITADDGPLGRQPAPTPEPPPKQFSAEVASSMLERPWHKRRKHDEEEPMTSWQHSRQPADGDDLEPVDGDETGQISELVESEAIV